MCILGDFQDPFRHSSKFRKITKIPPGPCALTMHFYYLRMPFYDGSNSSSFALDAVSLFLCVNINDLLQWIFRIFLGNYGGPYYGGFSKSIQAFSKIPLEFPRIFGYNVRFQFRSSCKQIGHIFQYVLFKTWNVYFSSKDFTQTFWFLLTYSTEKAFKTMLIMLRRFTIKLSCVTNVFIFTIIVIRANFPQGQISRISYHYDPVFAPIQ